MSLITEWLPADEGVRSTEEMLALSESKRGEAVIKSDYYNYYGWWPDTCKDFTIKDFSTFLFLYSF